MEIHPSAGDLAIRIDARYHVHKFVQDQTDNSVKPVEETLQRWLMDLEMNVHAAAEDHRSFHVRIVEPVRELVDKLPVWPGSIPAPSATKAMAVLPNTT